MVKVRNLINETNEKKFKIEDNMDYLSDGYFKRKDQYDITKNIRVGKSDTTKKYV